jgi:hypothetical protein
MAAAANIVASAARIGFGKEWKTRMVLRRSRIHWKRFSVICLFTSLPLFDLTLVQNLSLHHTRTNATNCQSESWPNPDTRANQSRVSYLNDVEQLVSDAEKEIS